VGCVEPDRAYMEVRLNASALSDPNSLVPSVSIDTFPNISPFSALVDSGSTHCFIDSCFVSRYDIPTYPVSPIQLRLFDGTSNSVITAAVDLPIRFKTGDVTSATFYVTPLDSSCFIVLGYNWLTRHNPLIDWVLSSIDFRPTSQGMPSPPTSPQPAFAAEQPSNSPGPSPGTPAPSVAAVLVFGGFKPFLEPGLSSNLTGPNRAINISPIMATAVLLRFPNRLNRYVDYYDTTPVCAI